MSQERHKLVMLIRNGAPLKPYDKKGTSFRTLGLNRFVILLLLLLSIFSSVPSSFFTSSRVDSSILPNATLAIDFVYTPNSNPPLLFCSPNCPFILIGDNVNFTAEPSGGASPYRFVWDFGDGSPPVPTLSNSTFHRFSAAGSFTVKLTVTDALLNSLSRTRIVAVHAWPIMSVGWVINWNLTDNDGIAIWNVTYHGIVIIRDARLAGVEVLYLFNLAGPFYDEPTDMPGVKTDGNIFYEMNTTNPSNPSFQLRAEYRVGGYDYTEAFRFYSNGMWEPVLMIGREGSPVDHIYEPHWRIDLALTEDANNYASMYTSHGSWQDLLWEGNYTDNSFRDPAHNSTVWRYGDQDRFYYIVPKIVRWDLDLPALPTDLILVRNHANEIDTSPHYEFQHVESPVEWVNGELAFRRDIVLWFVPKVYDHGPVPLLNTSLKVVTLTFYPWGAWS